MRIYNKYTSKYIILKINKKNIYIINFNYRNQKFTIYFIIFYNNTIIKYNI